MFNVVNSLVNKSLDIEDFCSTCGIRCTIAATIDNMDRVNHFKNLIFLNAAIIQGMF